MFTLYADASGGKSIGTTVVFGWLSQNSQWELFDYDWRILLAKYDLPYLHMREFAHFHGPFENWKGQDNKRANFLRLVSETIHNRVHFGFTTRVGHQDFAEVDSEYRFKEFVGNPYSLAARSCIAKANLWVKKNQRDIPMNYVSPTHSSFLIEARAAATAS